MSDYIPKDPYTPNDPRGYDRYGNARFEPGLDDGSGKGPYILLGLLVAIGLIGGLLYFNGAPKNSDVAQARNPAIERTMPTPAPATTPSLVPTPAPTAPADKTSLPATPSDTPKP
jgi:hypothetical protein